MSDSDVIAFLLAYLAIIVVIWLVSVAITLLVWWRIFSKAGFSGAFSLLMAFVPLANIVMLFYLAFAEWPIERELNAYRHGAGGVPPQGSYPGQPPTGPGYPSYPQY